MGGLTRQCTKAPFGFLTCCCCSEVCPQHTEKQVRAIQNTLQRQMLLLLGGRKSLDAKDQQKVSRSTYRFTTTGSHSHMELDATS